MLAFDSGEQRPAGAQVRFDLSGLVRGERGGLLRNLDIAEKLGCLTPENLAAIRSGQSPTVTRGPYAGEPAEVDHIVPIALAPELGNEIANLELLPHTLNRCKGAKVGARQKDCARKFAAVGVLSAESLRRIFSAP